MTEQERNFYIMHSMRVLCLLLTAILFSGCSHAPVSQKTQPSSKEQKTFFLQEISPVQAKVFLMQLGMAEVSISLKKNAVILNGSTEELQKASVILDLVDMKDRYVIETLAPLSDARTIPANNRIASALGDISIGTFTNPPERDKHARAIIDIHGDSVVAIIPVRYRQDMLAFIKSDPGISRQVVEATNESQEAIETAEESDNTTQQAVTEKVTASETLPAHLPSNLPEQKILKNEPNDNIANQLKSVVTTEVLASKKTEIKTNESLESEQSVYQESEQPSFTHKAEQRIVIEADKSVKPDVKYELVPLVNGEDILELDLPDRLEMIQLLDLVAEYVGLDYMFDPAKIKDQAVSLRLHGKLQGKIRVKDLYPLLESVLKFKGLAATCHKGNLVTILPVAEALDMDPALLDPNNTAIEAGDMVVTRIFDLQYVSASSAMKLLDSMKLSVAASPIEEIQALIITCYAHRMARIERLLNMVDRPGRPKEFRFRPLKYTMAKTLVKKVETLVTELQTMPGEVALKDLQPSSSALTVSAPQRLTSGQKTEEVYRSDASEKPKVFLDADERTNRILMIGNKEQLAIVDLVIETLDVAQYDPRVLKVYDIVHLNATDVKKELEELEVISQSKQMKSGMPPVLVSKPSTSGKIGGSDTADSTDTTETQVTVLESTNSLFIKATEEQHSWIETVISRIDMPLQDMRALKVYRIQHVDAKEVEKMLSEFGIIDGKDADSGESESKLVSASLTSGTIGDPGTEKTTSIPKPQVAIQESTNSLLINAVESQHTQIVGIIEQVDVETRKEAIPYEIYFLENQDPEILAEVIGRLVQETVQDKEGKVDQVGNKTEDPITIVPDKGTFSLVVKASKKNQDWVSKLIESLDKRRPQVLIEATLVEIRKTDEFNYDLNLIASFPDLTETGAQTGSFAVDETTTVIDKLLEPGMRDRFVDLQAQSGSGTGFYADKHVNALLTAMQTKDYGRVLANPKVLVNDNEKGTITTSDTTYVAQTSSIPVTSGAGGSQTSLIQTALAYESYDAGITLEITPHISEGKLLRLEIMLTRSDFGTITGERPPDLTSSDINTVVTVPDGSTIILGGMLKLNQSKGGSKVPILGDLPLVGGIFRSISNSDVQSKLYVFVRAEIIRPVEAIAGTHEDLERISEQNRSDFEKHEKEFQQYESWPGIKPSPTDPEKVLEAH
jgi:type II secretory pathway component GspD/PulD (secretin)